VYARHGPRAPSDQLGHRVVGKDEQALRLMVTGLMAPHDDTALQMVETAKLPNGSPPSFNDCHTRISKAVISGKITDAISDLEYNNAQPRQ
jgi:hypothetical protein